MRPIGPIPGLLRAWLAAWVLLGATAGVAGGREIVLYEARHRVADELVALAETVIGSAGSVTLNASTNSILLVGPEAEVERALEILRAQDRAPRTIIVYQEWRRSSELRESGIEIHWKLERGDLRIGTVRPPAPGDARTIATHSAFLAEHEGRAERLTLIEGTHARIETGTVVPYPESRATDRHEDAPTTPDIAWIDVSSGLTTSARVLANGRIRLELSPIRSALGPKGTIERASATTVLELEPGELRLIAGIEETRSGTRSRTGRSRESEQSDEHLVLLVRAELLDHGEQTGRAVRLGD
jgi:hypothetical protein